MACFNYIHSPIPCLLADRPYLPPDLPNIKLYFLNIHKIQFVLINYLDGALPTLECDQPTKGHTQKENWLSLSQQLANAIAA